MTDTRIRVLVVDDERIWYNRVAKLLPEFKVDWAKNAGDCRKELEHHQQHVVIMDLDLESRCDPDPGPGLELTSELTNEYFIELELYTAVVTLTYHDQYTTNSLTSGSIHVHCKPRTCEEIKQFNIVFPAQIRSTIYMVEHFRGLEKTLRRPVSEIEKGNIRLEARQTLDPKDAKKPEYWVHVSNKSERLGNKQFKILRILMESPHSVPADALMRQAGVTTRASLNSTLSVIRKKTGISIPASKRGYFLEIE